MNMYTCIHMGHKNDTQLLLSVGFHMQTDAATTLLVDVSSKPAYVRVCACACTLYLPEQQKVPQLDRNVMTHTRFSCPVSVDTIEIYDVLTQLKLTICPID